MPASATVTRKLQLVAAARAGANIFGGGRHRRRGGREARLQALRRRQEDAPRRSFRRPAHGPAMAAAARGPRAAYTARRQRPRGRAPWPYYRRDA